MIRDLSLRGREAGTLAVIAVVLGAFAPPAARADNHPDVVLRDRDGRPVIESGAPVSTMTSCADCHDTAWIVEHSDHTWLGLDEFGEARSGRDFDRGPGNLLRFDPVTYDRVDFDDAHFTIGLADWLRREGGRHVGGGLGTTTHDGRSLLALGDDASRAYTHARGEDGEPVRWDWNRSGVVEMNCFLCHLQGPADAARRSDLRESRFGWAATATLENTGIVERDGEGWRYRPEAFDAKGAVSRTILPLRSPTNENCGICHGAVVGRTDTAFALTPHATNPRTQVTGEVVGPGRISRSSVNVRDRDTLSRAWDVHAERLVGCTDCHPSSNDPTHFAESSTTRPDHLRYDARRIERSEYVKRPSHVFAKGDTAYGTIHDELDGTMRRCESCHDATAVHTWLPYRERHLAGLQCESCHVPQTFAPAVRAIDWTVLDSDGQPRREWRGVQGDPTDVFALVDGYQPVLLPRVGADGQRRLAPYNLVSSWYWFDTVTGRPVAREQLTAAWFDEGGQQVHPQLLAALDATGNGRIDPVELGLYQPFQVDAVRARLQAVGVGDPVIRGEVQPYGLHHGVTTGTWATRECSSCHGTDSRVATAFTLAEAAPGDVLPTFVADAGVDVNGSIGLSECGHVVFQPDPREAGLYLFGFAQRRWVDVVGAVALLLVLAGVALHGGLRLVIASAERRRRTAPTPAPAAGLEPETEAAR